MLQGALSKCTDRLGLSTVPLKSLLQCLTALSVRKCFVMTIWCFSGCSFEPFPYAPYPWIPERRDPSPLPLLGKLYRAMRSLLSLHFSEVEKPRVLSHSPQGIPSSPFTNIVAFLWMHSNTLTSFNCRPQNCTECSR